jgi:Zn-dependent protease/CBS domain-containing protein
MFESALRVGRVRGIRIQVHYTWIVIFALLSVSLVANFRATQPEWSEGATYAAAVSGVLLFFGSILLHELGHSLVAMARGIPVRSITLFIFGGVAELEKDSESARDEFWIAIAGPLVSLGLAAAFFVLGGLLTDLWEPLAVTLGWLAVINLALAVFNMVPGFPLDGGRVFRAIVWGVTGDADKGMRYAVVGGRLTAYGLFALGIWMAFGLGQFVSGIWFVAIGWFLMNAAESSGRSYAYRAALVKTRAGDLVLGAPPSVRSGTMLETWVRDGVLARGNRAALVVDEGGEVLGLVTLSDARKVPREAWSATPVEQAMTGLSAIHSVSVETGLADVLELMARHRLNQVPVRGEEGFVGWLDRDRVLSALRIRLELGGSASAEDLSDERTRA